MTIGALKIIEGRKENHRRRRNEEGRRKTARHGIREVKDGAGHREGGGV